MKRILNAEYGSLQALYWMCYAVVGNFASVFLLAKGYSNAEIGMIIAVGSIISVVLQPIVGDIVDRTKKVSLIGVIQLITLLWIVLVTLLFVFERRNTALTIVFVLLSSWIPVIQPLLNSLVFKIEQQGVDINFGVARSMGSLGFAVLATLLGGIVENFGIGVIPITGEITLFMFLTSLTLTAHHIKKQKKINKEQHVEIDFNHEKIEDKAYEDEGLIKFVKLNKWFIVVCVASIGSWYSNAVFNNFMLQVITPIGGSSDEMGMLFGVMAGLEIPVLIYFDKIRKKFSLKFLAKVGAVGFFLKTFTCMLAPTVGWFFAGHIFQMMAYAIFLPAMVHFINEIMHEGEAVKGQSIFTTAMTVGIVFASLTGGILLDLFGATALMLAASISSGVGAIVIIFSIGRIKTHN